MLSLAKIVFCLATLVCAFLSQLPLFSLNFRTFEFEAFAYSPVIILVFIFSAIFKNNYAFIALILILLGVLFGLPLFSFGGGWQYILEPSFGYILAMIFMSVIVFYQSFHVEQRSKRNLIMALLMANLFGAVFYIAFNKFDFIPVKNFGYQLFFDLLFAMIFLWLYKRKV